MVRRERGIEVTKMDDDDPESRACNSCGASTWKLILSEAYPTKRRDRDQTTKDVFVCKGCDAEGRRFTDGHNGEITWAGAMR